MTGPRIPVTEGVSGTFRAFKRTGNPFERIRHLTTEGREFWSARELMPLLGYSKWEDFANAIGRAKVAAHNAGYDVAQNFPGARKVAPSGPPAADFHLSRYACYLTALNGDPRKDEIAAAQNYFVIRTREAETAAPQSREERFALALTEAGQMLAEKDEQIAVLAPKAEFFDELMDADGAYTWQATANMLGWGRNVMLRELRKLGVVQGNRLPYQRYAHLFKVVPGTYTHPKTGDLIPCATTHVLPAGIPFLRKKLARSLELAEVDQ